MARRQTQTADSLPLVAIDLGSDSVRAMAARRIAPDLFQILGVEERPQKLGNICIEQGIITQSSSAGYVIAEVLKLLANRIGVVRRYFSQTLANHSRGGNASFNFPCRYLFEISQSETGDTKTVSVSSIVSRAI